MRRTTLHRLPSALVFVCVLLATFPAGATVIDRDTGFDPRDVPPLGHADPDIESTTRKLVSDDGRRVLSIVVRFYGRQGWWPLSMRLDARGDPRVDHFIITDSHHCYVWPKGRKRDRVEVRGDVHGSRFVCRLLARQVSPTKSIRWKVRTNYPDGSRGSDFVVDYAPSAHGWYG